MTSNALERMSRCGSQQLHDGAGTCARQARVNPPRATCVRPVAEVVENVPTPSEGVERTHAPQIVSICSAD